MASRLGRREKRQGSSSRGKIERRKPSEITDLVGRVPGVTVQPIGGRAVDIQVGHVPSLDFDRPCFPSVWLDGIPVREGGFQTEAAQFRWEFLFLNDVIPPEQIGGIEGLHGTSRESPGPV